MMRCLLLLALPLLLAVVEANPHHNGRPSSAYGTCAKVLITSDDRLAMKTAIETCITETDGLEDLLTTLYAASRHFGRKRRHGGVGPGGHRRSPVQLLEAEGYTTEATALRMCIADELGFLSGSDFDITAFKASLADKVTGTDSETNTQLGLDACPEDPLVAFDIKEYMQCVLTWCATGAAPA